MSESTVRLSHYIAGEWLSVNSQEWTAAIEFFTETKAVQMNPAGGR